MTLLRHGYSTFLPRLVPLLIVQGESASLAPQDENFRVQEAIHAEYCSGRLLSACSFLQHYVNKNVDWADPEQEQFGFDSTTQRVIPPSYNMAIPSHSPRFAATVVVPLLRSLKPHSEVWKHPRFPGAKSALPPFRRLIVSPRPLYPESESAVGTHLQLHAFWKLCFLRA